MANELAKGILMDEGAAGLDALKALGEHVATALPGAVVRQVVARGELTLTLAVERLLEAVRFLRDDPQCRFVCFIDITAVDYPEREKRFDVVTHLLSPKYIRRIRLKVETDERSAVPSLTGLFPAANWFEREVWDMFGVYFSDHPDLRRLLTDYGFEGHPLRKDFPMTGYVEVRWDDEQKRVVSQPVELNQAFRSFDFLSPWEGAGQVVLPGDEKAGTQEGQR
jgi:NADH-quinone oxidoreductase subunit C